MGGLVNSVRSFFAASNPHSTSCSGAGSSKIDKIFHNCHRQRIRCELAPKSTLKRFFGTNELIISNLSTVNKVAAGASILPSAIATTVGSIGSAVLSGALGFTKGVYMVSHAPKKIYIDYQRRNPEAGFKHSTRALMGVGYGTFGAATVISTIASYAGASGLAASAATGVATGGLLLYGASGVYSVYGLAANHVFRHRLNQHLQPMNSSGLYAGLSWLRNQTLGSDEKELNKNWDRFTFRSSEAACRLVREKVTPEFLTRVSQNDPAAILEAKWIVGEVMRENSKKLLKHYLFTIIALIGIAAAIAGLVMSGPFAPLLTMLGVILWVAIEAGQLDQKLGDLLFGQSKIPPPPPIVI